MFTVDETKTEKLGKILKEYRIKNNFSFRFIHKSTGIDISTIARLEDGSIYRINALVINSLARLYNINPLILLNIIGYVNEKEISEYSNLIENKKTISHDSFIEVFNINSIFHGNVEHLKEFIQLPHLNNNKYKAFQNNNFIFIYDEKQKLIQGELGIFNINDIIHIAYYISKENIVTLTSYIDNKNSMYFSSDIKFLGKVITVIDSTLNNKK